MSDIHNKVTIEAFAKINLTLEILGKRSDGYHNVRSIVMPIDLSDHLELEITRGEIGTSVTFVEGLSNKGICSSGKNLATKAARLLKERYRVPHGVIINIEKRIPIGGGLGGGSADAAATLIGLNRLWNLNLSKAALMEVAADLGCDVPAQLHGGAVCVEGRGEIVRSLLPVDVGPIPKMWVVIVNPGVFCSTADVYKNYFCLECLTGEPEIFHNISLLVRNGDVCNIAGLLFNSLQDVVFEHHPVIALLAARLREAGATAVLLSGSGASIFALVRDKEHGVGLCRSLANGTWSILTTTLPDGVMVAHGPLEP